jgi:hypothetical protein
VGEREVWEHFVRTPDNQLSLELLNLWARPKAVGDEELPEKQVRWWTGACAGMPEFTFQGSRKFVQRCDTLHSRLLLAEVASKVEIKGGDLAKNMSFQDWASLAWYHVVGSHNTDHLTAGVRVEHVRSWGGVMSYAAKYLGKEGDDFLTDIAFGRSWGVFNRAEIPWAKMVELELDTDMGIRIRRIARRYLERRLGRKKNLPYGVTLYCDVEQFRRLWEEPPPDPF